MADELKILARIKYENGDLKDTFAQEEFSITQLVQMEHATVVTVGTSEEDMPVGDVTTLGFLFLRNLDPAHFVTYGPKVTGSMVGFGQINPKEIAILRLLPGVTLRWIADTAAVKVQMKLFNN